MSFTIKSEHIQCMQLFWVFQYFCLICSQLTLFLSLGCQSDLMCSCLKLTVCIVWLQSKHGEHFSSLNASVSMQHRPDAGACSSPVPSVISLSLSHHVFSRHHLLYPVRQPTTSLAVPWSFFLFRFFKNCGCKGYWAHDNVTKGV